MTALIDAARFTCGRKRRPNNPTPCRSDVLGRCNQAPKGDRRQAPQFLPRKCIFDGRLRQGAPHCLQVLSKPNIDGHKSAARSVSYRPGASPTVIPGLFIRTRYPQRRRRLKSEYSDNNGGREKCRSRMAAKASRVVSASDPWTVGVVMRPPLWQANAFVTYMPLAFSAVIHKFLSNTLPSPSVNTTTGKPCCLCVR